MITHVFSNFQVPKILKKIMQKNLILHFFEMSAFEMESGNMSILSTNTKTLELSFESPFAYLNYDV